MSHNFSTDDNEEVAFLFWKFLKNHHENNHFKFNFCKITGCKPGVLQNLHSIADAFWQFSEKNYNSLRVAAPDDVIDEIN